ncbi:acyl-CoA thioesterase [bacterium]|nr:acyl-CoA thioesterase [bacterium]
MNPIIYRYQTRVRYAEIDRMGVAYHSRYIEWFEAARTDMLRERGLPYNQLEAQGISLPVIEIHCRYYKPVLYDELITVHTSVSHANRLKLHLVYEVYGESDDVLRANGYSLHCFVNHQGRPVRVDRRLADFIIGKSNPHDTSIFSDPEFILNKQD